jgi:hypothetical protein
MTRRRLATYLLLCVPYTLQLLRFRFTCDDAYISFRYARNLADGHGLRFNLDRAVPIEGYTNFLWTVLCAGLERLGMDVAVWAPLVSAACGYVLLWMVLDRLLGRFRVPELPAVLGALSLVAFPPFAVWSTGGLETMPFALLVFLTFDRLVLRERPDALGGGIAALALALMRSEGVGWSVVILALAALARGEGRRPLLTVAVVLAAGYAAYTAWRVSWFDSLVPNTVRAKLGGGMEIGGLLRGAQYVAVHFLTFLVPALMIPATVLAFRAPERRTTLCVAAMAWAFPAYAVVAEGDFMAMGRFLVPGLAFQTILIAWLLQAVPGGSAARAAAGLVVAALGALPGWNVHVVPGAVREAASFRVDRQGFLSEYDYWVVQRGNARTWIERGKAMRRYVEERPFQNPRPRGVTLPLGGIGYYSGLELYDSVGLVTPEVFRPEFLRPVEEALPGHDWYAPPEFFAGLGVDLFTPMVLETSDPGFVARACERQQAALREKLGPSGLDGAYVVDFARVAEGAAANDDRVAIVWRRIEGDPDAAHATAAVRLDSLRAAASEPPSSD